MDRQTKKCKTCDKEFVIDSEDFEYYKKIGVPAPTLCPECRYQRRLSYRNERVLYKRKCNATGKDIISIYPQKASFPVYDQKYWEAGDWDSLNYGREFDFSRPFFEQYKELQNAVPRVNLSNAKSVNSEYTNQAQANKNCYLLIGASNNEDSMYGNWVQTSKDVLDVYNILEGEQCYEVINTQKSSRIFWSMLVENSFDCWFCYDLKGCSNCFFCSNLRNKKYCWQNEQLSKGEWTKKFEQVKTGQYSVIESLKKQWIKTMRDALHKFANQTKVVNSSGDIFFECKNVNQSFNMTRAENCKYCQDGLEMKDCWDNTEVAFKYERVYEAHGSSTIARSIACNIGYFNHDIYYCDLCKHSSDLFGCISLKQKHYCILNKQYSKEEYNELLPKIIAHMKKTGEWGEFFPIELSPFAYNETTAIEYFPLTKEQAKKKGLRWEDNTPGTYDKGTIEAEKVADDIKDVSSDITKEILTCIDCGKNYKILDRELDFYKKMNLPIPRKCPDCRHYKRLSLRNPRKLWHRKCMCEKSGHFHKDKPCPNEFETVYSPKRPETIYCEECYKREVN